MFNGYDRDLMTKECPYPDIPQYLNKAPQENLTLPSANVTRICYVGDGEFTAEHVSKCAFIPNVIESHALCQGVHAAGDCGYSKPECGWN